VIFGALLIAACTPDTPIEPKPNSAPVARILGPSQGIEGTAVSFDGRASSDLDGDSLSYAWDFDDGSKGTGPFPEHAYRDNSL
jgi:hypothetical protein